MINTSLLRKRVSLGFDGNVSNRAVFVLSRLALPCNMCSHFTFHWCSLCAGVTLCRRN